MLPILTEYIADLITNWSSFQAFRVSIHTGISDGRKVFPDIPKTSCSGGLSSNDFNSSLFSLKNCITSGSVYHSDKNTVKAV